MAHQPVLLQEVVNLMDPKPGEVFVDGTLGGGGQALAIAEHLGFTGRLIGIDADAISLARAKEALAAAPCRCHFIHGNFRHLKRYLSELQVEMVDGILLDLGLSTDQLTESGRGFSFQRDEPLVMTIGEDVKFTARDIVNDWSEENITTILRIYGEENFAGKIAQAIVAARAEQKIETTGQLVEVIETAVPIWYRHPSRRRAGKRTHFATKTFQALRIAVNDELLAFSEALTAGWETLHRDGRLGVITFHSLEARIFKKFGAEKVAAEAGKWLTKKAVTPARAEIIKNPKSRSAQLKILLKQ